MRHVAIVGAGVAGLATAHLLSTQGLAVTVLEAEGRPGGHACTLDVPTADGRTVPADVGFMVFNDTTYPRFEALLRDLGVDWRTTDMSFGVSDGRDFEYAGHSPNALFATRGHLVDRRFWRMVLEYRRFNADARALLASDADPSLRGWLTELGYSEHFIERLLVPQASAVWSADPEQMWSFPARFLVQFFANHGMLSLRDRPTWRTIPGGSRRYVEAITARLGDRVRCATPVASVRRDPSAAGVWVTPQGGAPERFDEVVLACHADQALALLEDPTPAEREVLGAIPYQASELVLHGDASLLPRRRAARASWNFHLLETPPAAPTVTYDLGRLQGLDTPEPVLATLNLTDRVRPGAVHAVRHFSHPTYTPQGVAAQARHGEVSGADRVHFAGAYWSWGFHEDGVKSAHAVAERFAAPTRQAVAA